MTASPESKQADASTAATARKRPRRPDAMPVLEQLAALYPALFGADFVPLKRGIFQDLLQAHPDRFDAAALKSALALHTRSTRYLVAVADGRQRHDLAAQPVEPMAPEHVHHAVLEVFARRQARSKEDLGPALRRRLVQAIERSGLSPDAYAALVQGRDTRSHAVLDAALQEVRERQARDEALLRAFESGAREVPAFADMYGMPEQQVAQALARARRVRERAGVAGS